MLFIQPILFEAKIRRSMGRMFRRNAYLRVSLTYSFVVFAIRVYSDNFIFFTPYESHLLHKFHKQDFFFSQDKYSPTFYYFFFGIYRFLMSPHVTVNAVGIIVA